MYNSWQYDLMRYATVVCKGSMDDQRFDKALRKVLQKGIDGFYYNSGFSPLLQRYDVASGNSASIQVDQAMYRSVKNLQDGKIYFTNWEGEELRRMDIGGGDSELLVSQTDRTWGIAIDEPNQKIYYSTSICHSPI